jgi:membrane fusion protein, macrolide-specific efflux system
MAEAPPSPFRALLRRRGLWLAAAAVLLVAAILGYRWAFGKPKATYATATVTRGDLESTVVAAGIVQPLKYVDVGAQTSGKLKSLKYIRGDHVDKDALLGEIDPDLATTALASAKAAMANMTSLRTLKQATLTLAREQRDRNETLATDGIISTSARDITRADFKVAAADVASLTSQMKVAQASVDTAASNLGFTRITAPMAGEIVSISLLEGQTLNANQSAPNILRIADMGTVTVWAQVSEADISRVKLDQDVYFTVLGQTRRWNGKVRQILPTPELINNVVFFDVLFDLGNEDRALKIQMTAQVFIVLAQAKGVLLIPAAAVGLAPEHSQLQVQVLNAKGKVEARTITLGIKSELSAEVTSGLQEHERIVLPGQKAHGGSGSPLTARKGP